MGTIIARKRRDGTTGYTAQIRLKRDGKIVHAETETFGRRQLALEWMRRREAELDQRRARGEPLGQRVTLGELIAWYETDVGELTPWGRTKTADLARLRGYAIAERQVARLAAADYIEHVEDRRRAGAGPATAGNDLIWLRQVLRSARASEGVHVDLQALDDATDELRRRKLIGKSRQRDRRLAADEERRLREYFAGRDRRARIPMVDIMDFALASARRLEEITRLAWADVDLERGVATLRDVKHPRHKTGNDRQFRLFADAAAVVARQPRTGDRVFPYEAKSIGAAFARACQFLEIEGLHFHDLRHEATSRLFERGHSIQEVAQVTLHESWATLRRYTHLRPEHVPERR